MGYGLQLFSASTSSLVAYFDVEQAGCPTTQLPTSGYCLFRGVVNVVAKTFWLYILLRELHMLLSITMILAQVYVSSNSVQHQGTKHIELDIHFVYDLVVGGHVRVFHVRARYQFADIFTKSISSALFFEFRDNLSVRFAPAPTTRGC